VSFIKIQHGESTFTGLTDNTTITTVDLTKAFVVNLNNRYMGGGPVGDSGNQDVAEMSGSIEILNSTTVVAKKQLATKSQTIPWAILEYTGTASGLDEFIVRGTYELDLSSESQTQAVSGISNIDNCVPFITGVHSNSTVDGADSGTAMAWMTNGTLNVKRGSASNNTVKVFVSVVEFTGSNWSIGHGLVKDNSDTGDINLRTAADGLGGTSKSVTTWDKAFIVHQFKANNANGVDDAISDTSAVYYPKDLSTVTFKFHSDHVDSITSGDDSGNHLVHIVEHTDISVTRHVINDAGAISTDLDISTAGLSDLGQSLPILSRNSSGNGTAYGRGWGNIKLNSLTQANVWAHRTGNTVQSRAQIINFFVSSVKISSLDNDTQLDTGDTNEKINGTGFGALKGTGKIELADSMNYASATKVTQVTTNWTDIAIVFNVDLTGIANGFGYIFITDDLGNRSSSFKVTIGAVAYDLLIKNLNPDIYHTFNNTYVDVMGEANANSQSTTGSVSFKATPIALSSTHSWSVNDNNSRIVMSDSDYTNITNKHAKRYVGGWIQLDRVHLVPSGIYEEGGGINNIYMVVGFGNTLLGNIADSSGTPDFKVQAYSDIKLSINRPYHVILKYEDSSGEGRFTMFIDGLEVVKTDGNPITDANMSLHSGNWSYGKPDSSLDTGGTDIAYPGAPGTLISHFATWSEIGGGAPLSAETIRVELFEKGAKTLDSLTAGTEAELQAQLDTLGAKGYSDEVLALTIPKCLDKANFSLSLGGITFDDRCSIHIQSTAKSGQLTLLNTNGSDCKLSKCSAPYGGTILVKDYKHIVITGAAEGSKIVAFDHLTGDLLSSTESSSGSYGFSILALSIDLVVIADNYKLLQIYDIQTSGDTLIPITQEKDYSYSNPA